MTFAFIVSATIPASPRAVYDAWLDGKEHTRMTGGIKATGSNRIGGKFTAHGGYITGTNLELAPGKRIVQSWRTTRFSERDADSEIALTLTKVARGTRIRLRHSNVPQGHDGYRSGWKTHYFEPMKRYFAAKK